MLKNNNINIDPADNTMNSTGLFNDIQKINPETTNKVKDLSKIKRKIFIPQDSNFNFTGIIIGSKGANLKRLEKETGCKIYVRGNDSQKENQFRKFDENEPQHVLIVGMNEKQVLNP